MAINTADINGWRKVARALFPLLLPSASASVAWLLDKQSWRTALAGAIAGSISAIWTWSLPQPRSSVAATPLPPPLPSSAPTEDLTTTDLDLGPKAAWLVVLFATGVLSVTHLSCAGVRAPRTHAERCEDLELEYEAYGAFAVGAGAVGLSSGTAAFGFNDVTKREVSAGVAIGAAVLGPMAVFLRDQVTRQYGELCRTSTTAVQR